MSIANDTSVYRVPTADYYSFATLTIDAAGKYWRRYNAHYRADYHMPMSFFADVRDYCQLSYVDICLTLMLTVVWTRLRAHLSANVFTPWAKSLHLNPPSQAVKVPETLWKLMFYTSTWCYSVYILVLSGRYTQFWDPLSVWDDWSPWMSINYDIRLAYIIQASFYVHSIYATFYMDPWRKDSLVMVFHHLLTIALIMFSYGMRHHVQGMMVLLLHDISDVLLEVTKMNAYLKKRNGKDYWMHDWAANVSFVAFACSWFYCRLYLYPGKVIYMGFYGSVNMCDPGVPFIPFFNTMLFLLLTMNAWWFHFIILLIYRVATGEQHEVDDVREYELEQERLKATEETAKLMVNGNGTNGIVGTPKHASRPKND